MGEDDEPRVVNEVVKTEGAVSGFNLEVGNLVANCEARHCDGRLR